MRQGLAVFLALAMTGCATATSGQRSPAALSHRVYQDPSAAALVFAPPVTHAQAPLDLWRDTRTPGAFVGFDELSATYFYIRHDDRLTTDITDSLIRRSVSERVGVSYR